MSKLRQAARRKVQKQRNASTPSYIQLPFTFDDEADFWRKTRFTGEYKKDSKRLALFAKPRRFMVDLVFREHGGNGSDITALELTSDKLHYRELVQLVTQYGNMIHQEIGADQVDLQKSYFRVSVGADL